MNTPNYDAILENLDRRYRMKKRASRSVSNLIFILGVTSFIYGWQLEPSMTIFRFMTVDGTVFTTLSALACAIVNAVEIVKNVELTRKQVYYIRLSSAVAESVIFIVVAFSQLPIFPEHLPVFDRYDSFVMHLLIPVLCVASFLMNDAAIGRLTFAQRWHGTRFVTCYAAALLMKDGVWRERLLTLMYVTGTIGGVLGILLAYITVDYVTVMDYFASPRVWQYFIYHAMVVALGLYLGFGRGAGISLKDLKATMIGLVALDLPSFYLNSVFSTPVYADGKPVGVVYRVNFFSSYMNPLGLVLTEKWQWLAYLAVRLAVALMLVSLLLWLASVGGRPGRSTTAIC